MLIADWTRYINDYASECDWLGIREYREVTTELNARNGQSERNAITQSHGIMVEVLRHGQLAYAGTSNLTDTGVKAAIRKALKLADACRPLGLCSFDPAIRPANQGHFHSNANHSHTEQAFDSLTLAEIQQRLIDVSNQLNTGDKIIDSWSYGRLNTTQIYFVSSNGSQWQQDFAIAGKDFGVTAQSDRELQSRSLGLNCQQIGLETFAVDPMAEQAQRVLQQAHELLEADECPEDTRDLILTPDQLYLQVHESVGHPLELDRILGDERNYAGWSFVAPEDFGHLQYGSSLMNISFDPNTPHALANYQFDDNGVKAEKALLIKEGKLLRGIGGIESQTRSQLPGVACARASDWNRPPMDRMANINLEPGQSSLQDMIEATETGIMMQSNRSWSIDDYRNKFQFGCEYARLIENGELTKVVKNPNYRGVSTPFWNNLAMVGDASTFEVYGSPFCGKGEPNQVIRVGHAVPTCLFKNIEVFGGA